MVQLSAHPMATSSAIERFEPESRADWRAWLTKYHRRTEGVFVVFWKKEAAAKKDRFVLDYNAMVEEALCFGWVDSKPQKLDAERSMLYFAPRKSKSGWSRPNKERVERLEKAKLMQPAGAAKIAEAKRDGSWTMLDAIEDLLIPPDLERAFSKKARAHWDAFPRSPKRGILEWIAQAKRPETRAERIRVTAELADKNERANQWQPKPKG
jgi:uncharacterized protein YdeI (YjbR/CyaY-like superfamily)